MEAFPHECLPLAQVQKARGVRLYCETSAILKSAVGTSTTKIQEQRTRMNSTAK